MKLRVKSLSPNDAGRLLVRLNWKYRVGVPRYGIAQLTNSKNAKSVKVLALGHDDETAIFMPYDIRVALGVDKGGELEFTIERTGWFGKVHWLMACIDVSVLGDFGIRNCPLPLTAKADFQTCPQ